MTAYDIYNDGYDAGYEAAMSEFLGYDMANENVLDQCANFGSGISRILKGIRIRNISVENMIKNGIPEKEAVSKMRELIKYLNKAGLLKEEINPIDVNRHFVLNRNDLTTTGRKYIDSISDALHNRGISDNISTKIVKNVKKKRSEIDDDFFVATIYVPIAAYSIAWAPITMGVTILLGAVASSMVDGIRNLIKKLFKTESTHSIPSMIEDKIDMKKITKGTKYANEMVDLFDFDDIFDLN